MTLARGRLGGGVSTLPWPRVRRSRECVTQVLPAFLGRFSPLANEWWFAD